jgi:hypothetical protein
MSSSPDALRSCATCLLCLRQDYGMSNVTVDGTSLACLADLNPALEGKDAVTWPYPMSPALASALDEALICSRYRVGAPATLDVEWDSDLPARPPTAEWLLQAGFTDDAEAAGLLAKSLT